MNVILKARADLVGVHVLRSFFFFIIILKKEGRGGGVSSLAFIDLTVLFPLEFL